MFLMRKQDSPSKRLWFLHMAMKFFLTDRVNSWI